MPEIFELTQKYLTEHAMCGRQIEMILEGSLINVIRKKYGKMKTK